MSNIEMLKQELLLQKSIIEQKHGKILVKNNNPSPSEITEGIKCPKDMENGGTLKSVVKVNTEC